MRTECEEVDEVGRTTTVSVLRMLSGFTEQEPIHYGEASKFNELRKINETSSFFVTSHERIHSCLFQF